MYVGIRVSRDLTFHLKTHSCNLVHRGPRTGFSYIPTFMHIGLNIEPAAAGRIQQDGERKKKKVVIVSNAKFNRYLEYTYTCINNTHVHISCDVLYVRRADTYL